MLNLREWLEEEFEVKLAGGNNVRMNCPFCMDKKQRYYVSYALKERNGRWYYPTFCQNEQQSYAIEYLYSIIKNVSIEKARKVIYSNDEGEPEFGEVNEVLQRYLQLGKVDEKEVVEKPMPDVRFPAGYVPLWGNDRWEEIVPEYVRRRKIDKILCDKFFLGFTKPGNNIWSDRLIVPIYRNGVLQTYQGRAMHDVKEQKYIFKAVTGVNIGDCLYNFDNLDFTQKSVILTEGVFDAWAILRAGYKNVVSSFGKHITENALDDLIQNFSKIYLLWDMDAKEQICKLANSLKGIVDVYVTDLNGKDPDESSRDDIISAVGNSTKYNSAYYYNFFMSQFA